MATGLMGGTFDPVHVAHLIIAEEALERLGLESVIFVPAARPPHKPDDDITPIEHRLEMVRLAIADNPRLKLSSMEADRPAPSYTIDTIREFRRRLGDEEICFIMGADSLAQFFTWKAPDELVSECELVVVPRPGVAIEDSDPGLRERVRVLDMPTFDVASRDIRERVRSGRSIRYLVPPQVRAYIEEKNLYS